MKDNAALIIQIQNGDKQARDIMVEENMGLVYSIAKRFIGRGCEREDLIQIGAIGLIKAINNFDVSLGVKFSTYAVPMIMGEIRRFLRDDGMLKVSRSLKEAAVRGGRARELLQKRLDREPTIKEISLECGIDADELTEAFDASAPPESIYESIYSNGDGEIKLMDTLSVPGCEEEIINRVMISELLKDLDSREKNIVILRYFKDKTQSEISEIIGVSQVQISRLEKKIIEKLKRKM